MKEEQFIKINSNTWKELEEISSKVNKKGIKALPSKDVKKFLHIFRVTSHHLAYARTHYPQSTVTSYLNSLIGKNHSHIYAVRKISIGSLWKYIYYGFPKLLKENKWFIASSFGIFFFGMLLSMVLVFINPDNAYLFIPKAMADAVKSSPSSGGGQWNYPLVSSQIMVNNILVSLRAFVLGITLGIGTIYVLFFNGALLGSLAALVYMYGNPINFWSLILPHGVIELSAIFIAGAAGLIMAKSMLIPGEYSFGHSLIAGAKKAVALLGGIILMLVIAGIIEGFYTPLEISEWLKLTFAAVTAIVLAGYFSIPYIIKRS